MTDVPRRNLWAGLSTGGLIGLAFGIAAPRNSYAGVGVLILAIMAILVAFLMLFVERSRAVGAILLLSTCLMLAISWGVMVLRGL
jgi:hypothetical protein